MAMKIYGASLSGRTARVLAVLFEKDVTDFELVFVRNEHNPEDVPEFFNTQPFAQTPMLVDGDLTLFESRAIARYIAQKFENQGTSLYGSTLEEKAIVEQWLEIEAHKFHNPIAIISREKLLKVNRGEQPNESIVEANVVKLSKVLDVYDGHLKKNKYLAGDFFSMADLFHLPYLDHFINRVRREKVIDDRPHVKAWWEDISSRPAWKKVLAVIQDEFKTLCSEYTAQKSLENLQVE